ncbi:30S ribosomal protein S6 [Pendulispora brunnea]|uniref:Small ribosomal subunit protein bS6 n=1 Tax=Pendulispora brunnea TaxID=2905690 RepID=A0ABZ2KNW5_9BACT
MALATTTQALKTKEYETIYILRGDVDPDTAEKVQNRVAEVVSREAGKLTKVEAWGRRRLAYPVAKFKKGVYVYVKYVGRGGLVNELERNLKLQDAVLKFQTVLLKDDVDEGTLTIDPEEVKLARLELPVEEEEKESRERALGLVDLPDARHSRDDRDGDREDDFADEEAAPESSATPKAEGNSGGEEA